jgi:uncharacterized protein YqkB
MKDLIFVTAYCKTEEQETLLEKCVDSVIKSGKHIALISHSHVPIHIQKRCNYYFYDYLNDISDDYRLLALKYFSFENNMIQSIFFEKYFYGFAIYRMFSIASQIAINFGYQNIHHIEYDCELLDVNLINEHSKLLETHDSVIYTNNGKEDGLLYGSFKSFKVSSLPDNFKNYNRDFIENEIIKMNPAALEFLTKNIFVNSGNVLFKDKNEISNRFKGSELLYSRNIHYTFYYNPDDKSLNLFYKGFDFEEKLTVVVNKEKVINLDVKPNHWYIKPLGLFDEINYVRIDNSVKILFEKIFDQNEREIYKNKSFICEKNN